MGPPTAVQRAELMEEQLSNIQATIRNIVIEEVSAAVKGAVAAMELSLSNRFVSSFEETINKQEKYLEDTTSRLEGRINRSREHQESMILLMKEEQAKFQSEVRATMKEVLGQGKAPMKILEAHLNS